MDQPLPIEFNAPAVGDLEEWLDARLLGIRNLLLAKRRDYGTENIRLTGLPGIGIRLQDKVSRLRNLVEIGSHQPGGEPLHDTLLDIAGYAIIGLSLVERGEW